VSKFAELRIGGEREGSERRMEEAGAKRKVLGEGERRV